jgi:hypothetical protein
MKIVIAPDSFKASLSAIDGAGALAEGILQVEGDWDLVMVPSPMAAREPSRPSRAKVSPWPPTPWSMPTAYPSPQRWR